MNKIGVATYKNGSQGLFDLGIIRKHYQEAKAAGYKQAWRTEKLAMQITAHWMYGQGMKQIAAYTMDGKMDAVIMWTK